MKLHLLVIFYLIAQLTDLVLAGYLECTRNEDCVADDATCVDELCECPPRKIFSIDGSRCLEFAVGYESPCDDDAQCAWLLGKHICSSSKQCVCAEGWRYHNGRCREARGLSESCVNNEDCFVSHDIYAMVCDGGFCACNSGYYARGGYDCRREGLEPGDFCALDMDCKFENSYCDRSWCEYKGTRHRNVSENYDETFFESSGKAYALGSSCSTNEDCADSLHSSCSPLTKTCTCTRGYFLHASGECVAELGIDVGCTVDSQCTITPRKCVNGACACPSSHYFGRGNNKCVKVSFSPDFACVNDEWCSIMGPNAICVGTDETYCRCPLSMEPDENFICQRPSGGEDCQKSCVVSNDCLALQNSICENGVCICPPNHRLEENTCLPNIGGECNVNAPCLIEHTDCENGVCSCVGDYTPGSELLCVEGAEGLGSPCSVDLQCSVSVENSKCSGEICVCDDGFAVESDACWEIKLMEDYCVDATQCRVSLGNNVQCRNSMCQCSADMEVTPDGLDCRYPNASPSGLYASSSFLIMLALFCAVN